jgi:hypothetical protein
MYKFRNREDPLISPYEFGIFKWTPCYQVRDILSSFNHYPLELIVESPSIQNAKEY